jgi:hypothetical protein
MLTKTSDIDQTTVLSNGIIIYRETTQVFEDGRLLSKGYHRISLVPGQSLDGVPAQVADIATVVWTPDVIAEYVASQSVIPV